MRQAGSFDATLSFQLAASPATSRSTSHCGSAHSIVHADKSCRILFGRSRPSPRQCSDRPSRRIRAAPAPVRAPRVISCTPDSSQDKRCAARSGNPQIYNVTAVRFEFAMIIRAPTAIAIPIFGRGALDPVLNLTTFPGRAEGPMRDERNEPVDIRPCAIAAVDNHPRVAISLHRARDHPTTPMKRRVFLEVGAESSRRRESSHLPSQRDSEQLVRHQVDAMPRDAGRASAHSPGPSTLRWKPPRPAPRFRVPSF